MNAEETAALIVCSSAVSRDDLDGHLREIAWMDPVTVENGPAEFAADSA